MKNKIITINNSLIFRYSHIFKKNTTIGDHLVYHKFSLDNPFKITEILILIVD